MAQVVGRALGDEHINGRGLVSGLPCIGAHRVFIGAPPVPNPDANALRGIAGKLGVKDRMDVAGDLRAALREGEFAHHLAESFADAVVAFGLDAVCFAPQGGTLA